jgi:Skp family chaperone for outer membrane proteins
MNIDIVNLIENNPITKFNSNYQSKLVEKIKKHFNNYEQQLFLSSFYCYLNHDYKNDFVIDLDNVWQWLGFSQKIRAKELVEKNFVINTDYIILLSPQREQKNINKDYKCLVTRPGAQTNIPPTVAKSKKDSRGGHNKELIMLNINTFKKFCLKAGTKKADEIHDYFIKLEEILQEIMKEEGDELKNQLLQLEDKKNKELEQKLAQHKIIEREKILLNEYATIGSIFYVIKVKTLDNGQYIIKIGESRKGISGRYKEHKSKYDECLLLDCFTVNKSKDFETFIKEHESIRGNRVNFLNGHETELELFLIGKNLSYQSLLNIINHNIKYFNDNDISKLELENEKLKLMTEINSNQNSNPLIQELILVIKQLSGKIDNLEKTNKIIEEKINSSQTKTTTGFNEHLVTLGPRLQKINPETLQLIKVYESVSECMNENITIKRPSINKAINENTIYCGFRWKLVDRELDPNIIRNLEPTKETKVQNLGYIAKLNNLKTEIINVYLDRKSASILNGYASSASLDIPVKKFILSNGHYYKLYEECDDILKEAFIQKNNEKPILYKNGIGQYDVNNILVREFVCKYDCIKTLKISDKTLTKALEKNQLYNGHYYKEIGSKLKCL